MTPVASTAGGVGSAGGGLMGGSIGSTVPATGSVAQGLSVPAFQTGSMAPSLGRLPELGSSLTQGISTTPQATSGLFGGGWQQKAMDMAMQGMGGGGGGGEQRGAMGPQSPGIHGAVNPYARFPFSANAYHFRRGPGY